MGRKKNKTFEERCEQTYDFFMAFYAKNRLAPSYTDMVKGTGIRRGNLAKYVDKLVDDGRIERESSTSRGLWPANTKVNGSLPIHFVGHIAADNVNPLVVMDMLDNESTVEVPKHLLPPKVNIKNLYVLQVQGSSMKEAHILNGDYVIMEKGNIHRDNDIVAILLKNENAVTLKTLESTERGSIRVKPKSRQQKRIEDPENILVQGRVVAVMRKCL